MEIMGPGADAQEEISPMVASHGLLQKARAYLASQGHTEPARPDGAGSRAPAIREADRARILEEIEREVAAARTPVTPELLRFTPRRRGGVLPLAVNLVAVVVIAAGVLGAVWLSRQREQTAVTAATTITSAEGKLLDVLRKESEERLAGKDQEIADIRGKLAGLDQEQERLRADADARISARERELTDAMSATLETERQKLLASGLSEAAVAKRIADLESKARAESERQLAELRRQAEEERAAQAQAAEQLRTEYQRSLTQAQSDRSRIQEEAARKQADLEAGYRQKQLGLEQDKAAALAELEALRRARERETMVLDQVASFYREVRNEIAANRPEAAAAVLARFREYLDDPSVAALPIMAQRRPVELFLIGSLEEIARARAATAADAAATQSLVASAGLVAAVAGLVEQGEALFADRDYAKAREVYLAALAKIPAVQTGTERLAEIERLAADQGRRAVNALFAEGNAAYLAGDTDLAADRYRSGLEALAADRGIADTLVTQLTQIGAIRERAAAAAAAPATAGGRDEAADAAERAALLAELAAATAELERLRAEGEAAAARATRRSRTVTRPSPSGTRPRAHGPRPSRNGIRLPGPATGRSRIGTRPWRRATRRSSSATPPWRARATRRARSPRIAKRPSLPATGPWPSVTPPRPPGTRPRPGRRQRSPSVTPPSPPATRPRRRATPPSPSVTGRSLRWLPSATGALRPWPGWPRSATVRRARRPRPRKPSRESVLALVQTKVLVQKVLLSDAVLAEYPDLADRLDRYLEALADESRGEAQLETLRDLDAVLADLAAGRAGSVTDEIVERRTAGGQQNLLLNILDELKTLLE